MFAACPFADDERDGPLADAWYALGDLIDLMAALFGAPASLRAKTFVERRLAAELADFIGAAETLLRRLLVLMAATLSLAPPPRRAHAAGMRRITPRARWAGFRMAERERAGGARRPAATPSGAPFEPRAAGYAGRYAAVLAVAADPWRYARRLARRHKPARLVRKAIPRVSPLRGALEAVRERLPSALGPVAALIKLDRRPRGPPRA